MLLKHTCVFAVKTEGKRVVKLCMYEWERKAHSSGVCVCPLTERMYMCVVGDVEVHRKLSRPKDGKLTNFVAIVNVFLLTVLLCPAAWSSERIWKNLRVSEINRFLYHVTGSKWEIYFCTGQAHLEFNCVDVVKNTGTWFREIKYIE